MERGENRGQAAASTRKQRLGRRSLSPVFEGGAVESENELKNPWERITLPEETPYKATYAGSGTFIISKPKRKASKRRQARLKNPQRGARK
jgi:hypothetical protein